VTFELKRKATILDRPQMARVVRRVAVEIAERNSGVDGLLLVGIRTRGVPFAERLGEEIEAVEGKQVPQGVLDITLYRDDLSAIAPQPVVKASHLPQLDGRSVVLCDDVLFTGRTIRAALDALMDYGRPKAVQLAVMVDRGHRELPIQADFVGETVTTGETEVVKVLFPSTDDEQEGVELWEAVEEG
jgi:pyrimidine operon attenuation protein/uracil phosphoribosyltransferase